MTTYTDNDLTKPTDGAETGAWGPMLNTNFDLIDDLVAGVATLSGTGGTDTLTTTQEAANEARNMILNATGALTSNQTLEAKDTSKMYLVRNATSGAYTTALNTSGGTPLDIPQGYQGVAWIDPTGAGVARQFSPWVDDSGNILMPNGSEIRSNINASDTFKISVYDVDGASYTDILTVTAGNTVTADLWVDTTINGQTISTSDTTVLVNDTTPQLGGMLDVNGQTIGDGTRELLAFVEDASAVNHLEIENEATGSGPILRATGDDTNVDLNLATKGSGSLLFESNAIYYATGTDIPVTDGGTGASDAATARTNLGLAIGSDVQAYNADTLFADATDTLTAGYSVTPYNAGTQSTGTFTPDEANGNFQYAVNGGAHTLAPPTNNCTITLQYTNNASAGTITTSGFTATDGDSIVTTNGADFIMSITKINGFSWLNVKQVS